MLVESDTTRLIVLLVWFGLVWFGLVWFGLVYVWFGLVWLLTTFCRPLGVQASQVFQACWLRAGVGGVLPMTSGWCPVIFPQWTSRQCEVERQGLAVGL